MTLCQHRNQVIILLLTCLFITSCNGQTSRNKKSITKTNPIEKIIRTNGTQSGVLGCELLDKDGNLWFSIYGEGAYRYDGKSFTNFTIKDGLCNNNVSAIIQDNAGNILLGTGSGICKFDGSAFTKYPIPDTLSIVCMLEDKVGNLWFGTKQSGVYCYNGKTLQNFLNSNKHEYNLGTNNQFILDMLQDKNGNLWFSSWNGGGVWKYDGKEFVNLVPSADYYRSNQDKRELSNTAQNPFYYSTNRSYTPSQDYISDDMIFSITEDSSGNIWFATRDHGLCRYNGKTFTSIGRNEGFNSRGATAILQDDKKNFWITTVDNGVWYYDGKLFTNFTENDGLVNNAVMNILKDKAGNLWFGTKYLGLSRYNGKTFTTFSQYDN
jgi:streptogramin lyase